MAAVTDALALQALSTPASGAPDALEVLVDALLEIGVLPEDGGIATGEEPAVALRRRAVRWARGRLSPPPNPIARVVAAVTTALEEAGLPPAVVGVVGPFVLRLHYLDPAPPDLLRLVRDAVARALPPSIVVETTCRSAR